MCRAFEFRSTVRKRCLRERTRMTLVRQILTYIFYLRLSWRYTKPRYRMLTPNSWKMAEIPAESVRKSPGFLDFNALINLGITPSLRYLAALSKNVSCYSCLGPGINLISVPILVLMGAAVAKLILCSSINWLTNFGLRMQPSFFMPG